MVSECLHCFFKQQLIVKSAIFLYVFSSLFAPRSHRACLACLCLPEKPQVTQVKHHQWVCCVTLEMVEGELTSLKLCDSSFRSPRAELWPFLSFYRNRIALSNNPVTILPWWFIILTGNSFYIVLTIFISLTVTCELAGEVFFFNWPIS